jgi:hypothetical protein
MLAGRRGFVRSSAQAGHDQVDPPRRDQRADSAPDLPGHLADRDTPPAANRDHHVVGGYPNPSYLPAGQVGHHATPVAGGEIIDGRAAAGRGRDGVKIDAVDHGRRRSVARGRDRRGLRGGHRGRIQLGHDTREGASSWSPLSGM